MRAGIDRVTGRTLAGWEHCVQSIGVILTTEVGERVMRRSFGAGVRSLQDLSATPRRIMEVYVAVAEALRRHEPGFRLRTIRLTRAGADGTFAFEMAGVFYPRGHLGDYGSAENRTVAIGAGA